MASVGTIKYKNGSSWIDILHPVNSFYISYASTSPASLFGGTWTQITGAAIRGNNSVGYTGSDTHTLTVDEIPSHRHTQNTPFYGDNSGSHTGHVTYWSKYSNTALPVTSFTGGGQHIQSCNAPSIVISGIALRRQIRGEW